VKDYAIRLVLATHPGSEFEIAEFRNYIRVGASPRAAQALVTAAKVFALMDGRFAVSLADVRRVALPALRHRIVRTFEAEADGIDTDEIVRGVLEATPADAEYPQDGAPQGAIRSEVRR
jgi:MoxR-like ATPase